MIDRQQFGSNTQDRLFAPQSRKTYHTPALEDHGEVRELTLTSEHTTSWDPDGGPSWPLMYCSSQS